MKIKRIVSYSYDNIWTRKVSIIFSQGLYYACLKFESADTGWGCLCNVVLRVGLPFSSIVTSNLYDIVRKKRS